MKLFGFNISRENRASIETPSVPLSSAGEMLSSAWGGGESPSGANVNEQSAMRVAAVNACVRVISETISSLPTKVYERRGDSKSIALDHPAYNLLHAEPNNQMTTFTLKEMMQNSLLLGGNGYAEIIRDNGGRVAELWPIPYDLVDTKRKNGEKIHTINGLDYHDSNILHVQGLGFDGVKGMSPISYMKNSVGMAISAEDYGAKFFKNDATPKGVLEIPTSLRDVAAVNRLKSSWQDTGTGGNRHKIRVLENGTSYKEIGMSNDDAQYLETRKFQVVEIARIFRVPPHLIADLENATFSNIEQQSISFIVNTIRPWLVRWEQEINKKLFSASEKGSLYAEFSVDGLLRGDIKARYEAYASGINAGWLTRNEPRMLENLNPIDGLDEPLIPMNMTTQSSLDANNKKEADNMRMSAILTDSAGRLARKETQAARKAIKDGLGDDEFKNLFTDFYRSHNKIVSSALGLNEKQAMQYTESALNSLVRAYKLKDTQALDEWESKRHTDLLEAATNEN